MGTINRYFLQLFDIGTGSNISIYGKPYHVVGKFIDRYVPGNGSSSDAYVFVLDDGRKELGLERRDDKWHLWFSQFERRYLIECLRSVASILRDAEKGGVERINSEGEVSAYHENYQFGAGPDDAGVFLGVDEDGFDVWLSRNISIDDLEVVG